MTDWYGAPAGAHSKPTDWYTPSGGSSGAKKAKHGVVGFFENLGSDVRDATVGLPMGLYNTAAHPIRTVKQTGRVEWQQWSPLVHGQFGKFGHQFVQHPLGPILDIAAIASLGLGATARVAETGSLGARAAQLATRSELKVGGATADAPEMTRALSRRPAARFRQNIVHEVTGKVHPFKNDAALYKQLSSKEAQRQQIAMNAHMDALAKAHGALQDPAKQAEVFHNMYWQIRKGPARAVKVDKLVGNKPPRGWHFVTENAGGLTADSIGQTTIKAGDNEVLFPTKGGFSIRKVQGFRERPTEGTVAPRAASANAGKAIIEPDGSISVTGGYKHEGGARQVQAPDGHVFVKTKNGYKLMEVQHTLRPDLFDHVKNPTARGQGDFIKELYAADQRFTTTDFAKAAKQRGGKEVLIVPDRAVRAYTAEAGNSATFLRKLYDKPTKVWRAAVLNMRPAYVVNNAVGNAFMYMMNHGDYTGMRAWVDSVKQVKGARYVERMASTSLKSRWMERHFGDEVGNTLGGYASEGFSNSALGKLGKGVQPLNIKMERMFRRALINSEVRRSSEVQALMKRGMSYDNAASKALDGNAGLRTRVLEHAHNTLGDYQALSKTDRAIRDIIPFWAWDKTIARHTAKLVDEQPVKAALGASIGTQGTQSTEKALGSIPDFLKGAIPLPFAAGPMAPGRKSILTTQGINPYSTIPDLADSVSSLVGIGNRPAAESIGSVIGPVPTIGIEGLTKQRFSGAPIPDKGFGSFGNALYDLVVNLPPAQLAAAATGNLPSSTTTNKRTGATKDKLYQKDWESVVSSWLGLPTRKLSPEAAAAYATSLANQRHTIGMGAI